VAPDRHLRGVRDSKLLTADARARAAVDVAGWAVGFGIGHASPQECDELGMTLALRSAAERALKQLDEAGLSPDCIVLDGKHNYLGDPRVETRVKADMSVLSVAAASVMAKVTRDALMREAAEHHPQYAFESNKGYPAPEHVRALTGYGPCTLHRRSWSFMDELPWPGVVRFDRDEARAPRLF
jgi:ribonuclease HII